MPVVSCYWERGPGYLVKEIFKSMLWLMLLSVAWKGRFGDMGISIFLKSGLPKKKKHLERNNIGTIWDKRIWRKVWQRKPGSKPPSAPDWRGQGRWLTRSVFTAILGPWVFLCGEKRFARCFSDASVVLPNAASEHCQDLDTLGPVPKQRMRRGRKKVSSVTRWPVCFARQAVYFCIYLHGTTFVHWKSLSRIVGYLP